MSDIYEHIFGKVQTGSQHKNPGYTDFDRDQSLAGAMRRFRNFLHGGLAGKNLSSQDADKIIDVIEPHLKRLPLGSKLSYGTKMAIKEKFWRMVLSGELTREDCEDAKRIVDLF